MNAILIENIEAFLEEKMSFKDLQEIAKNMGVTELEEKINWVRNSSTAIEATGLRNQLKEILPSTITEEAKVVDFEPEQKSKIGKWLWAAASVLILVTAYWGINRNQETNLYAKYEYIDPGLPVLMSQSDNHLLYDALTYYSEENYVVAESKLLKLQADATSNDTISYFLGASLLYQGKTNAAKEVLKQVQEFSNSSFKQKAEWLLVLVSVKENNVEKAKISVGKILDSPTHEFFEEAQSLQQDLNQ
ncbi:MAG: hypothetical protein AAGI07_07520 [Bacteroidota bacterium]